MMLFIIIWLWLSNIITGLLAVAVMRPVNRGDVIQSMFFPVIVPVLLLLKLTARR